MSYEYLIARLRARKGQLFQKKEFEHILTSNSVSQMRDFLRATSYGIYIEAAAIRFEDPENMIIYALRQHTLKLFQFIWKYKPKEGSDAIKLIFSRWEIYNLKLILRGIHKGIQTDVLRDLLIPAGEFSERRLNDLLNLKDFDSVVKYLVSAGSSYGSALQSSLMRFYKSRFFRDLEIDLDRFSLMYFIKQFNKMSADGEAILDFIRIKIEFVNILTLLKNLNEVHVDAQHTPLKSIVRESQFIEGSGRLNQQKYNELLKTTTLEALIQKLSKVLRNPKLNEILLDTNPDNPVWTEERLEDFMEKYLFRKSLRDPHGFYFIASFVYRQMREVKNLRFILSSIKHKLNIDEVRTRLFYPLIIPEKRSA